MLKQFALTACLLSSLFSSASIKPAKADLLDTLDEMKQLVTTLQREWAYMGHSAKTGEDIYLRTTTITPDRATNQVGFHYRIGKDTVLAIAECLTSLVTIGQVNRVDRNLRDPKNHLTPDRGSATDKLVRTVCFRAFN
jgi:hypothetical protein